MNALATYVMRAAAVALLLLCLYTSVVLSFVLASFAAPLALMYGSAAIGLGALALRIYEFFARRTVESRLHFESSVARYAALALVAPTALQVADDWTWGAFVFPVLALVAASSFRGHSELPATRRRAVVAFLCGVAAVIGFLWRDHLAGTDYNRYPGTGRTIHIYIVDWALVGHAVLWCWLGLRETKAAIALRRARDAAAHAPPSDGGPRDDASPSTPRGD